MNFLVKTIFPFIISLYVSLLIGGQAMATRKQYLILIILFFLISKYLITVLFRNYAFQKRNGFAALITGICLSAVILAGTNAFLVPKFMSSKKASVLITALGQKNDSSKSYEVWILSITNKNFPVDLSRIPHDSAWQLKDNKLLSFDHQPAILKINIDDADDPSIKFLRHPWCGKILVTDGKVSTTIDLYKPGDGGEYNYKINNLTSFMGKKDYTRLNIYYFITFLFLLVTSFIIFLLVRQKRIYYTLANGIAGTLLFLFPSDLVLSPVQIILLLILSLLAGAIAPRAIHPAGVIGNKFSPKQIILFSLIIIYSSFAFIGNTLFFTGNEPTTLRQIAFFILFVAWFSSIALSFLQISFDLKSRLNKSSQGTESKPSDRQFWGLLFITLVSVWMIFLLGFYPGIMSSDSLDHWAQAVEGKPLNTWHPVLYTYLIKTILFVGKNPAAVAGFQIVFMAAVAATFLSFLAKKGVPKKWVLLFTLFIALFPANGVYLVTILKDIPNSICLLWLTYILIRLVDNTHFLNKNQWAFWGLITSLVVTSLLSHYGILVFLIVGLPLLLLSIKNKNRSILLGIGISLTLIVSFKMYLAYNKDIITRTPEIKLIAPINGIAAVIKENRELPADINSRMETILPKQEWVRLYSPYQADGYQFQTNDQYLKNLAKVNSSEIFKMYARTLYHNPYFVIRDRLEGTDIIWNVSQPTLAHNSYYNTALEENQFGLAQKKNDLKAILENYLKVTAILASDFFWRAGIYNVFLLLLVFFTLRTGTRKHLLIFLPWLAATISLMPALLGQEFRFVFFIPVLFWFIYITVLSPTISKHQV